MTTPARRRLSGVMRLLFVTGLAFFCAAPTPGDVGGCGQNPQPLDPGLFFAEKASIDCEQCHDCDYHSDHCARACMAELQQNAFPEGCEPLVHDGEVCLRALRAAGCGDYEDYVKDTGRQAPSECLFCPWETP